jgi:hypothetical protein
MVCKRRLQCLNHHRPKLRRRQDVRGVAPDEKMTGHLQQASGAKPDDE